MDNPRMGDPAFVAIWVRLLMMATHKPYDVMYGGKRTTIQPGQLVTGRKALAAATGVNASKVQRVLDVMKSEQQIEQQTCSTSRLITICNWATYQKGEQQSEQQVNSDRTASEQRVNTIQEQENTRTREQLHTTARGYDPATFVIDAEHSRLCMSVIDYMNDLTGSQYTTITRPLGEAVARWGADKCKQVLHNLHERYRGDQEWYAKMMNLTTPFNAEKFEGYLNAAPPVDEWEGYNPDGSKQ